MSRWSGFGGTRVTVRAPAGYDLARDVCSYGYFLLAPNRWDVSAGMLTRALDVGGRAVGVRIGGSAGGGLSVRCDAALSRSESAEVRRQVRRMLRLDEGPEDIAAFHALDGRWAGSGRGRLFRSPTLFEDVVKTVTSCNVAWTSTITMNERLCGVLGRRSAVGLAAFPTAARLARARAGTLRGRCRVGYRDGRLIALARMFARGEIDEAWLTSPSTGDGAVFDALCALPGIGPYAAGNIMQLLGRYSRLALDSESVRHARAVLGMEGEGPALMRRLAGHYERFGAQRFRSYWFELWSYYESKRGPAHLWDRETTGRTFTAAMLKD